MRTSVSLALAIVASSACQPAPQATKTETTIAPVTRAARTIQAATAQPLALPTLSEYRALVNTFATEVRLAHADAYAPALTAYRDALDLWSIGDAFHAVEIVPTPQITTQFESYHLRLDSSAEPARIYLSESLQTIWAEAGRRVDQAAH